MTLGESIRLSTKMKEKLKKGLLILIITSNKEIQNIYLNIN